MLQKYIIVYKIYTPRLESGEKRHGHHIENYKKNHEWMTTFFQDGTNPISARAPADIVRHIAR